MSEYFAEWRAGKPWGNNVRLSTVQREGVVALPVERAPDFRSYASDGYWLYTKTDPVARVCVSFDQTRHRRTTSFVSLAAVPHAPDTLSPEVPADQNSPRPGSAMMEQVVVEECLVEMSAEIAAKLAATIIQVLSSEAPSALAAAGLIVAKRDNEKAADHAS